MKQQVYNRRDRVPAGAVYVGRGSRWGNPFSHRQGTQAAVVVPSRDMAISCFEQYALERLQRDPHWLDALVGKDLVCWCKPAACHADVLVRLANR